MAKRISELDATSTLATGDELLVLQTGASKRGSISTTPDAGKVVAWPASASDFVESLTTPLDEADPLTSGDELLVMQAGVPLRGEVSSTPDAGKVMAWPDAPSGTFTPEMLIGGASTGITYTSQIGTYLKIGDYVMGSMRVQTSNKGSLSGDVSVSLPFGINDSGVVMDSFSTVTSGISIAGMVCAYGVGGTSRAAIAYVTTAGVLGAIQSSHIANNTLIIMSFCYKMA